MTRLLGWAAIAGTLPYLTLKALWLSGSTLGVTDPALLADPTMQGLNVATVLLDLTVIALALALTHPFGRRLPAVLLVLPAWVGTGLLVPITVAVLPSTLLARSSEDFLALWVRPLVYGGFAWQAVFLLVAFVLYARRRWAGAVAQRVPASPLQSVTVAGGVVTAALSAVLHLLGGDILDVTIGVLAAAGAAGVVALSRGRRTWLAAVGAWTGSAAAFAWGLWAAVLEMTGAPLVTGHDVLSGLAQLTGLLGGFALAVAGLLTLGGAQADSTSASKQVRAPV